MCCYASRDDAMPRRRAMTCDDNDVRRSPMMCNNKCHGAMHHVATQIYVR